MKINQPVTEIEHEMFDDVMIVSKTDLKGIITYTNQAFIDISGFSQKELIGKNHNLVRHPDVPSAAFQDLWDTIKQGKPWVGIVKNRCKNGDYYWVKANVTPLMKNGRITEYMSVRTKPTRDEINSAITLYAQINTNSLPAPSVFERFKFVQKFKIWQKLAIAFVLSFLVTTVLVVDRIAISSEGILFAGKEEQGLHYLSATRRIIQNMPQHRGMTNAYLNGNKKLKAKIIAKRLQVDENFEALLQIDNELSAELKTGNQLKQIYEKWNTLKKQAFILSAKESFSRHTEILEKLTALMASVGSNSGLLFDPVYETNNIIETLVERIPVLTEKMGQSRGLGAGIISRGYFNTGQKDRLISLQVYARLMTEGMRTSMEAVFKNNPEIELRLAEKSHKAEKALSEFEKNVNALLKENFSGLNSTAFFNQGTRAIDASFELYDEAALQVEDLLQQRIDELSQKRLIIISIVLFGMLISIAIGVSVIVSILRDLQSTSREFEY